MKDKDLKIFLQSHRQPIDDAAFTKKIGEQLNYYPQPQKAPNRKINWVYLIPLLSLLAGVWLVAVLGGWSMFAEKADAVIVYGIHIVRLSLYAFAAALIALLALLPWREETFAA
jgi:hypothetical protein